MPIIDNIKIYLLYPAYLGNLPGFFCKVISTYEALSLALPILSLY